MSFLNSKVLGLAVATTALYLGAAAAPAHAHIDIIGAVEDRGGDQKTAPCGGERRGSKVYTFEPGATVQIEVKEQLVHDGYFRISFDNDGTDGFKDPVSIDPINPNRYPGRKCEGTAKDRCGKSDFCSIVSHTGGPSVLWDNIDPHLGASVKNNNVRSYTVTLPNIECSNCTLQVQQVMEDPAGVFHGPFDGDNDLYYRCIDIVLKKGAGKTPGTVVGPAKNNGIDCLKANPAGGVAAKPDAGVGRGAGDGEADEEALASVHGDHDLDSSEPAASEGGCAVGSSDSASSAAWLLLALGALLVRTRKRHA